MMVINKIWSYKINMEPSHDTCPHNQTSWWDGIHRLLKKHGRFNNPVFFINSHYPSKALPPAVWTTSSQSQTCLESWIDSLKFFQTTPFVIKGPTKDLIFSCQMTMLGKEGLFTCNAYEDRQLSSVPFSTLQSNSNFISSSNKISLIWSRISTIYGLIIYPDNDQLLVGLIAHMVEHCTGTAEVRVWVLFRHIFCYCFKVPRIGSSVGWASGYHAGGREFNSDRTNTQGLKIAEQKVLPL